MKGEDTLKEPKKLMFKKEGIKILFFFSLASCQVLKPNTFLLKPGIQTLECDIDFYPVDCLYIKFKGKVHTVPDTFVKLTKIFAGAIASSEEPIAVGPVKRFSKCSNLVFLSASLTILFLVTLNLQLASLISDLKAVVSDTVNPLICVTIIDCEFKKVLCKLSTNSSFCFLFN